MPKTLTAILAGIALPTAGLLLQVLFRNPLAGPYALGISSGASLAVAICLLVTQVFGIGANLIFGKSLLISAALGGSFLVTLVLLAISSRIGNNVLLLLIGLMIAQICGALMGALEYFAEPGNLKNFVLWGLGSLSATGYDDLLVFFVVTVLCGILLLNFLKPLNALLLGEAYAQNLGIDLRRSRFFLILISSLLTGICTAYCGPIAFVGISVPILSRLIFDTARQEWHLTTGAFLGATLLLFSDALTHNVLAGSNLPVNILTTLIGAPIVLYLMFKNKTW